MKSFDLATNDGVGQMAETVMETVSIVTRTIKEEMRRHRPGGMSMQHFRALGIVERHPAASLSFVSGHLGLTNASACKLVDNLVKQGLLTRTDSAEDRRRVALRLTEVGQKALQAARAAALGHLAEMLSELHDQELLVISKAMSILRDMLTQPDAQPSSD